MKLILLIICINVVDSAKILAVFPMPSLSHHILGSKIVSELVKKGHEVVMVTPYPHKNPVENIPTSGSLQMISVAENLDILKDYSKSSSLRTENTQNTIKATKSFFHRESHTTIETIIYLNDLALQVAEKTLSNENFQKLIQSKQNFDLILMEYFLNEAYLGLGTYLSAPVVLTSTLPTSPFNNYLFANPGLCTYTPHVLSNFGYNMNFWQRLENCFNTFFDITYKHLVMLPKHKDLSDRYISENINFEKALYNVSLLLVNSHPSVTAPVPHAKNVIEIGGFHIVDDVSIPASLKAELDDASEGVVIFSMGSNLNSNDVTHDKLAAIVETFSKLKQKVIWKWDGDIQPDLPKNIKTVKWFPQQALLAHPNVKAFVTHGGLLSVLEAVHRGVPIVGIPVYGDQKMNIATAVEDGYAVLVPYGELTYETFSHALKEVLYNDTYKQKVQFRSKLMKDRLTDPLSTAIYWIEYVLRYQGASHLKSPAMLLTWYQRNMIEIIIILTLITFILFVIFYIIFKHIIHCGYFRKVSDERDNNKKRN